MSAEVLLSFSAETRHRQEEHEVDPIPGAPAALLRGHIREEVGLDQQKLLPPRESGGPAGRLREGPLAVIVASRCHA